MIDHLLCKMVNYQNELIATIRSFSARVSPGVLLMDVDVVDVIRTVELIFIAGICFLRKSFKDLNFAF